MSEGSFVLPDKAPVSGKYEKAVRLQRARLAEMVVFARTHSPYYRALYHRLPDRVTDVRLLPVTDKQRLMAQFDDWVTDREVTIDKVRAFVSNLDLVGQRFLGKYLVATTSGTTGTPGTFVVDDSNVRAARAVARRAIGQWLSLRDSWATVARSMRVAILIGTGGHYIAIGALNRLRRSSRLLARICQGYSVDAPLPQLVADLNLFRPAILVGYATVISLLSREQVAGRLQIDPVLVVPTAEGLPIGEYERIARAFGAKVRNFWGSTEIGGVAVGCEAGWMHVVNDWAVIEPVDADYRPTPRGESSHTVLVSNLANRVQPILRYDLGDSLIERPDPCPCGNPMPAIRVRGRAADVLSFPTERGEPVAIPPLAWQIDDLPGVEQCQIVQRTPTSLDVRLRLAPTADSDRAWQAVRTEMLRLLASHELHHVAVERARELPEQSAGGKYRAVIPLS